MNHMECISVVFLQSQSDLYDTVPKPVSSERTGMTGSCTGAHEYRGPMLIYVCCVRLVFNVFKHIGSTNVISICLI